MATQANENPLRRLFRYARHYRRDVVWATIDSVLNKFFDILPEVFALDGGASYMPLAAIGFLVFFGLERYTALHGSREHEHAAHAHEQELGALSAAGLTFHSFLDGVAIGVGFQTSSHMGYLIALGIIAHDLSDGMNTVTVVLAHGNPRRRAGFWLALDMIAPLLGAVRLEVT